MAQKNEAIDVAQTLAGERTNITHRRSDGGRHEFDFSNGCVQAHRVPEGWQVSGFGSGWFSLVKR